MDSNNLTETVLGPSLVVTGDLSAEENLVLQGRVEGTVTLKRCCVTVGEKGRIEGDVQAQEILVQGTVKGNLNAKDRIQLDPTARVFGDLEAPRVSLQEGARFSGQVNTEGVAQLEAVDSKSQPSLKRVSA